MATNFMPGEWSMVGSRNPFLSGGIPGMGSLAGFGSDFLSSKLGIQPNMLGSIGGLAGTMFGPLGSFAGGFLGNALGSAFGIGNKKPPRPRVNYVYDFETGNPFLKGGKVYDDEGMDVFGSITDYIGDTSKGFLDKLGLEPGMDRFGFGAFQGRTGFTLGTDPFVRDPNSPGAFNAIGPSSPGVKQAQQMGRVFGSLGGRTSAPTPELIQQAADAAFNALVLGPIQQAGLTNADVFGKFGLPTELEALKGALPNLAFGDDFSLTNPFQFKATDLLSLYNQPQGGQPAPTGTMPGMSAPPMGTNANNLMNLYTQMRPRMQSSSWQNQPSYYSRWQ